MKDGNTCHTTNTSKWTNIHYNSNVCTFCKVKRGNLEQNLDFGTCCPGKFCSKSKMVFVWEAHRSTAKASKSWLTLLLYLGRTHLIN